MRTRETRPHSKQEITFDGACSLVETALTTRPEILAHVATSMDFSKALLRLRDSMRSNVWEAGARAIHLDTVITPYDQRTRRDGFHALHDWDGQADTVNEDTIPVDVLNYLIDKRGAEPPERNAPAILLDYYFLYVLALLSLRIWDEGNADANLDRLDHLLQELQGPDGSGQQFASNAETLMLIATAHYELDERAFVTLLERVRTLNHSHRTHVALVHALSMGCHLRFGFEATYGRDTVVMREDNSTDYPWLCFALATLMKEYARMRDEGIHGETAPGANAEERIVEGLLNGLSPDARAFVGEPPASLAGCEVERSEFREIFYRYRHDLLEAFERHRPSDHTYSPLSFFFNFSHNVLKGMIVDALLHGEAWNLTLNDLLTESPRGDPKGESKEILASTLMGYARASPHRIRGRLMPVIVYDPRAGHQAFALTMRKIRG